MCTSPLCLIFPGNSSWVSQLSEIKTRVFGLVWWFPRHTVYFLDHCFYHHHFPPFRIFLLSTLKQTQISSLTRRLTRLLSVVGSSIVTRHLFSVVGRHSSPPLSRRLLLTLSRLLVASSHLSPLSVVASSESNRKSENGEFLKFRDSLILLGFRVNFLSLSSLMAVSVVSVNRSSTRVRQSRHTPTGSGFSLQVSVHRRRSGNSFAKLPNYRSSPVSEILEAQGEPTY